MKKKDLERVSSVLMVIAGIAVLLAGIGYLGMDIWLASTQWLLVAAVTALFGVYFRVSAK